MMYPPFTVFEIEAMHAQRRRLCSGGSALRVRERCNCCDNYRQAGRVRPRSTLRFYIGRHSLIRGCATPRANVHDTLVSVRSVFRQAGLWGGSLVVRDWHHGIGRSMRFLQQDHAKRTLAGWCMASRAFRSVPRSS
jgi:hypothetical protein